MPLIIHKIDSLCVKEAIVIPSYHKSANLRRIKNTIRYVTVGEVDPRVPVVLFLQDAKDIPAYSQWIPNSVIIWNPTDAELTNLPMVRYYIQKNCTDAGMKVICMMDDDLRFTYRDLPGTPNKWHNLAENLGSYIRPSKHTFMDAYKAMKESLYEDNVALSSLVLRFGSQNHVKDKYDYRISHVFTMALKKLAATDVWFNPNIKDCEDFRFSFDLANAGLHSKVLAKFVHDDYANPSATGGVNEYRNVDKAALHNEETMKLVREYPDFCRAVWEEKSPYSPTGAYNPRMNWKKIKEVADNGGKRM